MTYDQYEKKIIEGVKNRLGNESWFRGVCRDLIPQLWAERKPLGKAIESVVDDTIYWDHPNPTGE